MKIGIGIDTGGTCTDAVIYHFGERKVLAWAKTATTREDLSVGIEKALQQLPQKLTAEAEVISLSTTLATNACVENKGGRAKTIFFGANRDTVLRIGREYGLSDPGTLIFIDSKTKPDGQIVKEPDWQQFREIVRKELNGCDAVGVAEMFAKKSGAVLEKKAREIIREFTDIPVVCGHQLFAENNIVKRGACVLLNAKLIAVIREFTVSVKKALKRLDLDIPFVIVRSDGSLMSENFAEEFPVETLLCGPVASLMGAVELTEETDCVVVDMGGTTTDIALMKNGVPKRVKQGVRIGGWNTFVKGPYVDTFGLGGDSGVVLDDFGQIILQEEKVMPLCMAGSHWPSLQEKLEEIAKKGAFLSSQREEIYAGLKDISGSNSYTEEEQCIAGLLQKGPLTLEELDGYLKRHILKKNLSRLIREGVVIRCGVTPTDAMHLKGDFAAYNQTCASEGIKRMASICRKSEEQICDEIYEAVCWKLYYNLARILLIDQLPALEGKSLGAELDLVLRKAYEDAKGLPQDGFLQPVLSSKASFIGVGAPTHVFLPRAAGLLGARVITPEHSQVANALGAIVGNISAKVVVEVTLNQQDGSYTVFGKGERYICTNLEEAKELARQRARAGALQEAVKRGAQQDAQVKLEEKESIIETEFGPLFMGYKVSAAATGSLACEKGVKEE